MQTEDENTNKPEVGYAVNASANLAGALGAMAECIVKARHHIDLTTATHLYHDCQDCS